MAEWVWSIWDRRGGEAVPACLQAQLQVVLMVVLTVYKRSQRYCGGLISHHVVSWKCQGVRLWFLTSTRLCTANPPHDVNGDFSGGCCSHGNNLACFLLPDGVFEGLDFSDEVKKRWKHISRTRFEHYGKFFGVVREMYHRSY